jgi:hypothetical protein
MTHRIDLSNFSLKELQELEQQIASQKAIRRLGTYTVNFCVTFDINNHQADQLTSNDGRPSTSTFFDYIKKTIFPMINKQFDLGSSECVHALQVGFNHIGN